jgi:ABC-type uncharacterized transport system YnjBCD ATPase subunit
MEPNNKYERKAAIRVINLSKRFDGQQILANISFDIAAGEVLVVLGPWTLPNLRGPSYFTANLSLQRDFRFTESARLQIRAEAFNIFNRANFQIPGTVLGAANLGIITGTEDPRQIQFAARIYF